MGRHKQYHKMIYIRVRTDQYEHLRAYAKARKMGMNEIVREQIDLLPDIEKSARGFQKRA